MTDKLIDCFDLYESREAFFALPKGKNDSPKALRIDRQHGTMELVDKNQMSNAWLLREYYGIFGTIRLIAGHYLLLVSQVAFAANVLGKNIYRVGKVDILPCFTSAGHLSEAQCALNTQYADMLRMITALPYYYLAYDYDLTLPMQVQVDGEPKFYHKTFFERSNKEFVWNRALLGDLTKPELAAYCIPIILGFVDYMQEEISKTFKVVLISRRSCERAGTRMHMRGADTAGNVANFVETEQLVFAGTARASFVITRGSIPLQWTQRPNLRYKPPPELSVHANQAETMEVHLRKMFANYGPLVVVNLINQTGAEGRMYQAFKQVLGTLSLGFVDMINFDFHHECSGDRWENLAILMDMIRNQLHDVRYFMVDARNQAVQRQEGVFRINCIDSLDRTNVVQSMIARAVLTQQLRQFGVVPENVASIDIYDHIASEYRRIWADNADVLSTEYAGTGALKSDFTRTGKRRFKGKLEDGLNALTRYYKNNFEDGFKQDAIDLLLGRYRIQPNEGLIESSPLAERNLLKIFAVPIILMLVMLLPLLSNILPLGSWLTFYACLIMLLFSIYLTIYHGYEFVDQPRLVRPTARARLQAHINI